MKLTDIARIVWLPVTAASLCCLSPLLLVLFGLGSVSFASSLADTLYGDYKWYFRFGGILLLVITLVLFYRSKGVCTLNQVRRQRNEIINAAIITLLASVLGYIFFLYVVVHFAGAFLELWSYTY